MYKIFFILTLMFFINVQAQEVIQIGTTYNEASARIEAFKDVNKKIEKEFYKKYLKDPNRKENLEFIEKGILQTDLGRELCPFYLKNTLISYSITYLETPQYNFYYNILGSLAKFDIIKNIDYPRKILGYSRYGNLVSVSFEADENEQGKNYCACKGQLYSRHFGRRARLSQNQVFSFNHFFRG